MTTEADLYLDRFDRAEELFEALLKGDPEKAGKLLSEDPSLAQEHQPHHFDASAMNLAVMGGKKEAVDLLLQHGASANDGSIWWAGSFSPLMTAIHRKDASMIRHLIEKGAEVTAYEAAAMGDIERLREILERNPASANMRGGDGQTPLHVAANPEAAELLLAHGANLETKDIDHVSTPVQYAMDRPEVAEYLLEKGARGDVFLFASLAAPDRLKAHLEAHAADVQLKVGQETFPTEPPAAEMIYSYLVGNGCTPLHVAARFNRPESIRALVGAGANPNVRGGYDDSTPLHLAAWNDSADAIGALAECDADINVPSGNIHQNSPLGWAIVGGSLGAVEALLEIGAKIEENHRREAESGVKGGFNLYSHASPENRARILELISEPA